MKPGDVIDGKYRIEVALGEGGMGQVFAASHLAIGNTVAIKVLKPEALAAPEVAKRFMREARAAGRLRSEHVVRVTDVGALAGGEPYMVMEMLHGNDLATRLAAQGPLPYESVVEFAVQACEGLAEAHGLGMVHRDIKPANLFVTARPNGAALVKVLDFGIATAATGDLDPRLTTTQSVMGSPSYMSPEQLKGARDVDARSDIWSLGVTMYELLSGKHPFTGPTLTALSLAIVSDPHRQLAGVPALLVEIVDRCLAKEPADRFDNVADLARALSPLWSGGKVAAELVAGSFHQPVAPTLHGIEDRARTAPPVRAHAAMTSTTSLASGETGALASPPRRRWVWIAAGFAMTALLGVGLAWRFTGAERTAAAGPATPQPAPQPAAAPQPAPAPAPVTPPPVPAPTPVVAPEPAPPEPTPAAPAPAPKVRPRPRPRPPQPQPAPQPPAPVIQPAPPPPSPTPDPVKKPCAPNDPRCGL